MIGVAVRPYERDAVTEFFELFKTPWEFYQSGKQYDVVLSTYDGFSGNAGRLLILFDGDRFESSTKARTKTQSGLFVVSDEGRRLPIYESLTTFPGHSHFLLNEEASQESAAFVAQRGQMTILRIGYNLFSEIRFLLTTGQPAINSSIPTVEEHIGCLRDWITRAGIPSIEIPPIPNGYNFVACLTHDIDHPALRNHWCDHTMFGFLYRAIAGTCLDCCRGKRPLKNLWKNWRAALQLPLVHLGIAHDFWSGFDRYLQLEKGHGATFFVIPRKNYPGRMPNGPAPSRRACRYDVDQLLPKLTKIISTGGEVGVHGLDAWLDAESGRREWDYLSDRLGTTELGVRMHWLFFNENSPKVLDRAGFSYDSTVGFRDTVGYKTGTMQVYKPFGVKNLMELPLHIMDTALFYPGYLNLKDDEAKHLVRALLNDAEQAGGVLTINWHDRSIAPERLWGDFYLNLLGELKSRGAWLPNAARAVAWFRKRRASRLEWSWSGTDMIRIGAQLDLADALPGLKIRVFKPRARSLSEAIGARKATAFVEKTFDRTSNLEVAL
jgi:hypothetical protein